MIQETLQAQVRARALKDPAFRQALLSNPRAVLAKEYNVHLPEHVVVRVLEEAPNTLTLVLPAQAEAIVELTDADLQAVSGGERAVSISCEEIPQ
jgi:Nitrile hydratase, alpha chain